MFFTDFIVRMFTPAYMALLMEGGAGLCAGIFIGFLAKNFGRTLTYFIAALIILALALSYVGTITIHYDVLKTTLGLPARAGFEDIVRVYGELIALRKVGFSAGLIGVVIGWRIG